MTAPTGSSGTARTRARALSVAAPRPAADPDTQGLSLEAATILAGTLSLLSEPTRLRIPYLLDQVGEMAVGGLA